MAPPSTLGWTASGWTGPRRRTSPPARTRRCAKVHRHDDARDTGLGMLRALHSDDVARTAGVWRKSVADGRNYECEYRLRRHDGVYRHFLARGMPVLRDDGTVLEWVGRRSSSRCPIRRMAAVSAE